MQISREGQVVRQRYESIGRNVSSTNRDLEGGVKAFHSYCMSNCLRKEGPCCFWYFPKMNCEVSLEPPGCKLERVRVSLRSHPGIQKPPGLCTAGSPFPEKTSLPIPEPGHLLPSSSGSSLPSPTPCSGSQGALRTPPLNSRHRAMWKYLAIYIA